MSAAKLAPSPLKRGRILEANMSANEKEADELVLELAEKYRPPNVPPGMLLADWGYGRGSITEALRKGLKHCEDNRHAQYSAVE